MEDENNGEEKAGGKKLKKKSRGKYFGHSIYCISTVHVQDDINETLSLGKEKMNEKLSFHFKKGLENDFLPSKF